MDIILCPNAEEASLRAAALITNAVRARPATVLGLATGSTPLRLYQALIQACRDGLD
ncbi:MAG: glucosamine-6-phosphate deaminase, partial [Lentisphaerae bacterium]|nr:glucosamine-6-phosphate deaminase [Lentisphaerota bacterium]